MNAAKKLKAWADARLITKKQADAIAEFEKAQCARSHLFSYLFLVMAVLFCLWGIVSIIAYNWNDIPKYAKLAVSLSALAASAFGIRAAGRRENYLWHEAAILAHAGLIACNIALVAQIYQLDSDFANGMLLWTGLALPALFASRGPWLCWGWLGILLGAISCKLLDTYDLNFKEFLLASGAAGLLMFFKYFAIMKTGLYTQFAKVFLGYGFALLAFNAISLEFFHHDCDPAGWPGITLFILMLPAFYILTRKAKDVAIARFALFAYALFILLFIRENFELLDVWGYLFPRFMRRDAVPFLTSGFVYTMSLMCAAMYALYRERRPRLFNEMFVLAALRLTIFMFDRFRSLLLRGVGFIFAGLMFFGFFKLWQRISAGMSKGKGK